MGISTKSCMENSMKFCMENYVKSCARTTVRNTTCEKQCEKQKLPSPPGASGLLRIPGLPIARSSITLSPTYFLNNSYEIWEHDLF